MAVIRVRLKLPIDVVAECVCFNLPTNVAAIRVCFNLPTDVFRYTCLLQLEY